MSLEEQEAAILEKLTNTTLSAIQMKNQNEIMSSLLAKISYIVANGDLSPLEMTNQIELLLEWYNGYQAGIFNMVPVEK